MWKGESREGEKKVKRGEGGRRKEGERWEGGKDVQIDRN